MFKEDNLKEKVDLVAPCTTCNTQPCSCAEFGTVAASGSAPGAPATPPAPRGPAPGTDPLIGQIVSEHYQITELIGSGGMGAVYKAKHTIIGKVVAIKVLSVVRQDDSKSIMRFQREAQAVAGMDHANIVSISHFGFLPSDQPYIIMDYVSGRSLSEILKQEGAMQAGRAMRIFSQICEALTHAQSKGIIHRDLKPANIMISKDESGKERVKVVDFGIAKIDQLDGKHQTISDSGEVLGSPLYMSPEQCAGTELDWRSDIYSLGCLMYETIVGVPPLTGMNALQTIYMHINEKPQPPSATTKNLPPQLESIILRCLEKDPADRFQSAAEIKAGLEVLLSQLRETRKPSGNADRPPKRTSTPLLRLPSKGKHLLLIAVSLVGITALAVGLFRYASRGSNEFSERNVESRSAAPGSNETAKKKVERLLAVGRQLNDKSKNSEAIQTLTEADSICNQIFPDNEIHAQVDFYLAEAQALTPGEETNALENYKRAADLYAKYSEYMEFRNACMNAGCCLRDQRNYVGANELYKKAVENADLNDLRTTDPESYVNIVTMYAVNTTHIQGHEKEAARLFDTALRTSRDSRVTTLVRLKSLRDAIGFYISTRDYQQAQQLLHQAGTIKITQAQAQTTDYQGVEGDLSNCRKKLSMPE